MPEQSRQLAAIMFTDIVGYTALMGRDEQKAMQLLDQNRDLQKPLIEEYLGKYLKDIGDGILASFGSAGDAVSCALAIQNALSDDQELILRIGIHSGDITFKDEDVFGDGVNIASRLQSIADPGGIYISESIHKAIRGRGDIQAQYLGETQLKNVDYPVKTYALQGVGLPIPALNEEKQLSGRLWAEMQRRGVVRAGVAYLVVALLLILLLREAQNWLTLPDLSFTILVTALAVGFPLAMYLAWNYERSPEGFVKTTSQQSWQNPYSVSQRKPMTSNVIIIGLVLVIGFMYLYPRFLSADRSQEPTETTLETPVIDKSIAVIPFINMSNDPDQEYFSDGMMEEILNHLVKIRDLQVISRTSVMRYKGTTKSGSEIARELGVATILGGSVRKAGDRVRISVQLIDGGTNMHLWSETYDRKLDDVFAIQSEVALRVASTLDAQIQPEIIERMVQMPTHNMEAYDLYLKALGTWGVVEDVQQQEKVKNWLTEAIRLDSNFATPYALLGNTIIFYAGFILNKNPHEVAAEAKEMLEKALLLDPLDPIAHATMGAYYLWYEKDFSKAEIEYLTALRLAPSIPIANIFYLDFLLAEGRFDEAIPIGTDILKIQNIPANWGRMALVWAFNNEAERMNESIKRARQAPKSSVLAFTESARAYLIQKQYKQVLEILDLSPDVQAIPRSRGLKSIAYYKTGDIENHNMELNSLIQRSEESAGGSPSFYIAMIYGSKGNSDEAFRWLEKSVQDNEVELYWLKVEPEFEPLYSDPRWQEMLDKVGFPE